MKKLILGLLLGALIVPAVATAASSTSLISSTPTPGLTPLIFGGPGTTPSLAPNCARKQMWITPAGKTWAGNQPNGKSYVFAISTVMGGQIKCLIHRMDTTKPTVTPPDTCWDTPVPAVKQFHGDDWMNVDAFNAWVIDLRACELARQP